MKDFQIYLKGEDKTASVRYFKRIGNKYQVTFQTGKVFTYNARNVRIIKSVLAEEKSRSCFDYLKEIAQRIN